MTLPHRDRLVSTLVMLSSVTSLAAQQVPAPDTAPPDTVPPALGESAPTPRTDLRQRVSEARVHPLFMRGR